MRKDRAVWVALGVLALACGAVLLHDRGPGGLGWLPGCSFRRLTGLNCPGCGMTRAASAALHGDFATAFRLNPVGMVLLPVAMLALGIEAIGWVRGRPLPFRLKVGARGAWVLFAVLVGFWVLRNLPFPPFTYLAPP